MKRIIFFLSIAAISFSSFSCEESFNPKAEFRERYVLNSLIDCNNALQKVYVMRSYDTDGNPADYGEDLYVRDAEVKVWYDGAVYIFQDSSEFVEDSLGNMIEDFYYFNESLQPEGNKLIEIEAFLSNGFLLSSQTTTPNVYSGFFLNSDSILPPEDTTQTQIIIRWNSVADIIYVPKLMIEYYKVENSIPVYKEKEIPLDYYKEGGEDIPLYPSPSNRALYNYYINYIKKALIDLSVGDPNKLNYTITRIVFILEVFDLNMSVYYNSIKNYSDSFTVKVDEPDYSNVAGGYGIFGSYFKIEHELTVERKFLFPLGY